MSRAVLPHSVSGPLTFKQRHPWLSYMWDGGRLWATRLGCVWVHPDELTDLE